jgi:hypothetical protein
MIAGRSADFSMETELQIRLHAYAATAAAQSPSDPRLYADAVKSSQAAAAAASAALICSHPRELQGDSQPADLPPGQDELDLLAADKPTGEGIPRVQLPLHGGSATLADLARGADGVSAVKNSNG